MIPVERLRWLTMGVFALSSALNYLDRLLLQALAPTVMREFSINKEQFGYVLAAFSLTYAIGSPLAGMLLDRLGLTLAACLLVGLWSLAGMSHALVGSFAALLLCRAALGLFESGGIPASAKAAATYLAPKDRALGSAISQVGLTVGSMLAPPLFAAWIAPRYGWRMAFVIAGAIGFLWIPLWLRTARSVPVLDVPEDPPQQNFTGILADPRFLALIFANMLSMTVYSLWTNWTTLFIVEVHGLGERDVNLHYAWLPPVFATIGGLFGGWLARRFIVGTADAPRVRLWIAFGGSLLTTLSAAAPWLPTPLLSTAAICLGLFFLSCLSVNYYSIPLDLFGQTRSAFGVSFLTGAYGLMQVFVAPLIGGWSDKVGWRPVCFVIALLPLLSVAVLWPAISRGARPLAVPARHG